MRPTAQGMLVSFGVQIAVRAVKYWQFIAFSIRVCQQRNNRRYSPVFARARRDGGNLSAVGDINELIAVGNEEIASVVPLPRNDE